MRCFNFLNPVSRRSLLQQSACGFAGLSLAAMADQNAKATGPLAATDLRTPLPHLTQRAKRVIFLFMWGGPSHVDLFDYKPRLNEFAGKVVAISDIQFAGSNIILRTIIVREDDENSSEWTR